jgi:cytochrome c oxidase subunit 3
VGFAQGSHHLTQWLGTLETADLLTASMLAALALHAIRHGHRARSTALLGLTALLGAGFLVMHGTEYAEHVHKGALPGRYFHMEEEQGVPGISMFFTCYWFLTVLHSFHVLCGVGVLLWMAWLTGRGRFGPAYHTPVELVALYWHFVDVVWVFLYPMFYLVK